MAPPTIGEASMRVLHKNTEQKNAIRMRSYALQAMQTPRENFSDLRAGIFAGA